jgi:hypothetical protein
MHADRARQGCWDVQFSRLLLFWLSRSLLRHC